MASPFVTKLDLAKADQLKETLVEQGFELSQPPYTLFAGRKAGVSCTLYTSGKLVVQGKQMREFIEFVLEPQILGTFEYTNPEVDLTPRIGCDEAGKGDFFGPLCIAGVGANSDQIQQLADLGVADSKRLSDTRIEKMAVAIRKSCPHHIITLKPEKYNELYARFRNLNNLLAWAHATVIEQLAKETGLKAAIVDQFANNGVLDRAVEQKQIPIDLTQKIGGESDIVVAAASILARAAFVNGIAQLSRAWELDLPKGAGPQVPTAGRRFVAKHGEDALRSVAKLHFKTREQLTSS